MKKKLIPRTWLSLKDAAGILSTMCDEPVTEAHVLQLGMEGTLGISVRFVNPAFGTRGIVRPITEDDWRPIDPQFLPSELAGKDAKVLDGIRVNELELLELTTDTSQLEGVYDLWMHGGEQLDVEQAHQETTGGPDITRFNLYGVFVRGEMPGEVFHLVERPSPMAFDAKRKDLEAWEQEVAISSERAEFMDIALKSARAWLFDPDLYIPLATLPSDAVLVVRPAAIAEFEREHLTEQRDEDRPLGAREKTTYLNIVAALLESLLGRSPSGKALSSFGSQAALIDYILQNFGGTPGISKSTLENKFSEARRSIGSV